MEYTHEELNALLLALCQKQIETVIRCLGDTMSPDELALLTTEVRAGFQRTQESLMALAEDLAALRQQIDVETTRIATILQTLVERARNSLTDAEKAQNDADFQAVIDRLRAVGADPVNPIPPETAAFKTAVGRNKG